MQVKMQQLELDMEQQTVSKSGKEYVKAVYCHPAYLTYMQSTSCKILMDEAQAGIKTARRNINNLRYADDTILMEESEEELKSLLMKVNEESEKVLKLDIQQTKIEASSPISSLQFISFSQLSPTLCNPMDSSMPGLPVHHQLLELTQTHAH